MMLPLYLYLLPYYLELKHIIIQREFHLILELQLGLVGKSEMKLL